MTDRPRIDASVAPGGVFASAINNLPEEYRPIIDHGDGAWVESVAGDEYLDYIMGSGPAILGHAHPKIVDAIHDRASRGTQFHVTNEDALALANEIADACPGGEQVLLTSSGSEATYYALRLARAYTGREKVIRFEGGYHGFYDSMRRSSERCDPEMLLESELPTGTVDTAGAISGATEATLVTPFNDLETTIQIVENHSDDVAAIIVEPLHRNVSPEESFLEGVRELADENDIVLIFDEIVTGFRLAWGGGQEYYGVTADLVTYGKTITGGVPIAAVCGPASIMEAANPELAPDEGGVFVEGTFNGNALSAAAGLASLDVLGEDGTYDQLNAYGEALRNLIDDLLTDSSLSGFAMGDGSVVDYVITEQSEVTNWRALLQCDAQTKRQIDRELLEQGLLQHFGGKRYVSLRHRDREFEITEEAYKAAIETVASR